ncbi:hypothetical protein [Mycolicibacterium sp. XJ1904]
MSSASITNVPVLASVAASTPMVSADAVTSAGLESVTCARDRALMVSSGRLTPVAPTAVAVDFCVVTKESVATRSERFFFCSRSIGASESIGSAGGAELSTTTGALVSTSPTVLVAGVDAASAAPDSFVDSVADCFADESTDCRSAVELLVDRVSVPSGLGFVVERPEPTDVLGFVPETVDAEELPVDSEAPSLVDEEDSDVPVDPDVELDDPDDELADPADELEDDCPPSSAIAVPMPQVPTNPATPSEKATAPTRNATLAEFTSGPPPPSDR